MSYTHISISQNDILFSMNRFYIENFLKKHESSPLIFKKEK